MEKQNLKCNNFFLKRKKTLIFQKCSCQIICSSMQFLKGVLLPRRFALKSIRGRQRAKPEQPEVLGSTRQRKGWWRRRGSEDTSNIASSWVRIVVDVVVREAAAVPAARQERSMMVTTIRHTQRHHQQCDEEAEQETHGIKERQDWRPAAV